MLASRAGAAIRYTLGVGTGELVTPFTEEEIINDVSEHLANMREWKFLERQSLPLSLIRGQSHIDLPSDFRSVVATEVKEGILNTLEATSFEHLLQLRNSSIQSQSFSYYFAIITHVRHTENLLGHTEDFAGASWTHTSVTPLANQAVSPSGEAVGSQQADRLTASAAVGSSMQSFAPAGTPPLLRGVDYVFSIYLKRDTTSQAAIVIQQKAEGGGVGSVRQPKTTLVVDFDGSGVATISSTSTQGIGTHAANIISIGNGWYRCYASITWDDDEAKPSANLFCEIFPDTAAGTNAVYAWGAQLEAIEVPVDAVEPTRYDSNLGAFSFGVGVPVRRMEVWPTPRVDQLNAFLLFYRASLNRIVNHATDSIEIPSFLDPLYLELCRAYARGVHEEDEANLSARMDDVMSRSVFLTAVEHDDTQQMDYGPLRGVASTEGWFYRDWGSDVTVPPPG